MRNLRLSQRLRASRILPGLIEKLRWLRNVTRRRTIAAVIASALAVSLCCLPASAPAGIDQVADAIEQVFNEVFNALLGTEFEPQTILFAYKPPAPFDSVHVEVTVLGYAFCSPSNPWADPNPSPTFPENAYGCINDATVDATVNPEATSSDIVIGISDFFMDIEYAREETPACLECGPPLIPCGTVTGEGFLLSSGTIAATLELERVGSCVQATIVPGSVSVTLSPKDKGFKMGTRPNLTDDTCVIGAWDLFAPFFFDMLNQSASEALEAALVAEITPINEALCALTPVETSTWGKIKSLYR